MKKIIIAIILIIVLIGASVWGLNYQQNNTIKKVKLTDIEELFSVNKNMTFIFDYKAGKEYKEFKFWVEKYEEGLLVDDDIISISMLKSDEEKHLNKKGQGTIILNVLEINDEIYEDKDKTEIIFNMVNETDLKRTGISLFSNQRANTLSSSTQAIDILSKDDTEIWNKMQSDLGNKSIAIDSEMHLGSIMYNSGMDSMATLPAGVYSNLEVKEEHLKEYDVTYLLKAEFSKK